MPTARHKRQSGEQIATKGHRNTTYPATHTLSVAWDPPPGHPTK